jgi:hypothetical protein
MFYQFLNFIISPEVQADFLWIKILFLGVSLLMLGYIVYFLFTTRWFKHFFWFDFVEFFTLKTYGSVAAAFWWNHAREKLTNHPDTKTVREVIIGGHKAIGRIMERMVPMFQASTFSERLARLGPGTFSDTEILWKAHNLCKKIAKEPAFEVDPAEAKQIIDGYEKALVDLGILK